jgi:hypothetical protein
MPSLKPDDVNWATDPGANIIDPPAGKKLIGWVGLDIPPNGWVNWFWNITSSWINYLTGFTSRGVDSYVISDLDVVPQAVPNNSQVRVNPGFAVANGEHVEWESVGTLNLPALAGTAAPGAPQFFLIVINENGSISPIDLGTFPNRAIAVRAILPGVGNYDEADVNAPNAVQPPRAMLALVVNQDGQPLYDADQIIDVRQLRPISGRLIEEQSMRQNQMIDPGIFFELDFGTQDETVSDEHRIDVVIRDFGELGLDDLRKLREEVKLQIKVYPHVALTVAGEFGNDNTQYRDLQPWGSPPTGNDDVLGVKIEQDVGGSGLSLVQMVQGDDGGLNYWAGDVKPRADRTRVTFARYNVGGPGLPERIFIVELSTDHGSTTTQFFTFRAT